MNMIIFKDINGNEMKFDFSYEGNDIKITKLGLKSEEIKFKKLCKFQDLDKIDSINIQDINKYCAFISVKDDSNNIDVKYIDITSDCSVRDRLKAFYNDYKNKNEIESLSVFYCTNTKYSKGINLLNKCLHGKPYSKLDL